MSEYLRRSRTVHFGPIVAKVEFGTDVKCARITVTVVLVTSQHRRVWKRAVERLGIVATEVDRAGSHRDSGEPRTVSYSCQGTQDALDELAKLYVVESVEYREAAIPFGASGQGAVKPDKGRSTNVQEKHVVTAIGRVRVGAAFLDRSGAEVAESLGIAIAPNATGPWA